MVYNALSLKRSVQWRSCRERRVCRFLYFESFGAIAWPSALVGRRLPFLAFCVPGRAFWALPAVRRAVRPGDSTAPRRSDHGR